MFFVAAAVILAAAFFLFYQKGAFLPESINWQEGRETFGDGEIRYGNREATLLYEGGMVWHSAWNVNVQQCLVSDIDGDGQDELLMLVWKRGSYGPKKPFWVEKNDNNLAQHIFIYKWEPRKTNKLRAIWMSSAVSDSMESMYAGSRGEIYIQDTDGSTKAWYWENFGLKLLAEDCQSVSVIALGDQLLHLPVIRRGMETGDFTYMYREILDEVGSYDISGLNQETVYVADDKLISDYPRFGSPVGASDAVKEMGIDVVNLANNHALDKDMYGVDCSIDINSRHKIETVGVHSSKETADNPESAVTFMTVNDIKIAMLGFTYGTNGNSMPDKQRYAVELLGDKERLIKALDYARAEADCVIVWAHWGTEYSSEIDDNQREYSKLFMEHGVDAVIGTHPHVLQPFEYIHGQNHDMLVYYSLGNLISNQTEKECRTGGAATFNIVKYPNGNVRIANYKLNPLKTVGDKTVWDN